MRGRVVNSYAFEGYIVTEVNNKSLSVYPVIYKISKAQPLLEPMGG
jgi:hypothetical protein